MIDCATTATTFTAKAPTPQDLARARELLDNGSPE